MCWVCWIHGTLALKTMTMTTTTSKTNTENSMPEKIAIHHVKYISYRRHVTILCRWNLKSIGKIFLMQSNFDIACCDVRRRRALFSSNVCVLHWKYVARYPHNAMPFYIVSIHQKQTKKQRQQFSLKHFPYSNQK